MADKTFYRLPPDTDGSFTVFNINQIIRIEWMRGHGALVILPDDHQVSLNQSDAVRLAEHIGDMGYLVDSSSHYILGVGVPALVASTIVLYLNYAQIRFASAAAFVAA